MKNLKIKLGLLSLLAILAVSVFLTSCEQEYIPQAEQLTQDEIVAKMQNDSDVISLLALTDEMRTTFLDKVRQNNITPEFMVLSAENGTFNEVLEMLDIDVAEYEATTSKIKQLSQNVLEKYPIADECESCGEYNREEQLVAFQTLLDQDYLRGDCSNYWSWNYAKYTACVAHCHLIYPLGTEWICIGGCYYRYCT